MQNHFESDISGYFFEKAREHEALRGKIITVMMTITLLVLPLAFIIFEEDFKRIFDGKIPLVPMMIGNLIFLIYGIMITMIFTFKVKKIDKLYYLMTFLTTTIETSIPTLLLLGILTTQNNIQVLATPAVFYYFIPIILSAFRLRFRVCLYASVLAAGEYLYFSYYYVADAWSKTPGLLLSEPLAHYEKAITFVICGIICGLLTSSMKNYLVQIIKKDHEQERIKAIFGQHVSSVVMQRLIEKKEISGEQQKLAILFFDIRGFTKISEELSPKEVFNFINYIFPRVIDVIEENNGFVNKFLGDGLMAVFGICDENSNCCTDALKAASEIKNRIDEITTVGRFPKVNFGIGIHYGDTMTGNVGSSERKEYTVIGSTVNIASRIEGLCKTLNHDILVSKFVKDNADLNEFSVSEAGEHKVKGKEEAVAVYRLN